MGCLASLQDSRCRQERQKALTGLQVSAYQLLTGIWWTCVEQWCAQQEQRNWQVVTYCLVTAYSCLRAHKWVLTLFLVQSKKKYVHGVHYRLQIICHTLCLWFRCVTTKGSPQLGSEIAEYIYFIKFFLCVLMGHLYLWAQVWNFNPWDIGASAVVRHSCFEGLDLFLAQEFK